MKYKIEFSIEARSDLKGIIKYIKVNLKQTNIAVDLSNKIKEKIKLISENPKIYSFINDKYISKFYIRKAVVDNYLIFYKVLENDEVVQIVRIMYGRRNWINILNNE